MGGQGLIKAESSHHSTTKDVGVQYPYSIRILLGKTVSLGVRLVQRPNQTLYLRALNRDKVSKAAFRAFAGSN